MSRKEYTAQELIDLVKELKNKGWNPDTIIFDFDTIKFNLNNLIQGCTTYTELYNCIMFYQPLLEMITENENKQKYL